MEDRNTEFLNTLLSEYTPSSYENFNGAYNKLIKFVKYKDYSVTNIGNVIFTKGSNREDATKVMLSAHIDENAFQVSKIDSNGMLRVQKLGGSDMKTIFGSHVLVACYDKYSSSPSKLIPGIIGKKAIHKETGDERKKVSEIEDVIIDIGASSYDEVKDMGVRIGSIVVFKHEYNIDFGCSNYFVSNALDDKIGIYAVSEAFNRINEDFLISKNIKLILVWATQEEVGLRGATVVSKYINPDYSIDVDVTFDTDIYSPKANENKIELSKGAVIEHGPCNSLSFDFIDMCEKYALSYQEEVHKPGGHNGSAIQMNSTNCKTQHIGIPLRNMHTQVEMCSYKDVDSAIDIIQKYIENFEFCD